MSIFFLLYLLDAAVSRCTGQWAYPDPRPLDHPPTAYCATFLIGYLVVRVLGSPGSDYWSLQNFGVPAGVYVPVPVVDWHPALVLDDAGWKQFSESGLIIRPPNGTPPPNEMPN